MAISLLCATCHRSFRTHRQRTKRITKLVLVLNDTRIRVVTTSRSTSARPTKMSDVTTSNSAVSANRLTTRLPPRLRLVGSTPDVCRPSTRLAHVRPVLTLPSKLHAPSAVLTQLVWLPTFLRLPRALRLMCTLRRSVPKPRR